MFFFSGIAVLAQVQPGQLGTEVSPSIDSEPLSIGEKYQLALQRSFDPVEIFRMSLSAGLDPERNYPSEWGQGWDALGVRTASHFGQHLIREQIEAHPNSKPAATHYEFVQDRRGADRNIQSRRCPA